jgi:hypothetical protein
LRRLLYTLFQPLNVLAQHLTVSKIQLRQRQGRSGLRVVRGGLQALARQFFKLVRLARVKQGLQARILEHRSMHQGRCQQQRGGQEQPTQGGAKTTSEGPMVGTGSRVTPALLHLANHPKHLAFC